MSNTDDLQSRSFLEKLTSTYLFFSCAETCVGATSGGDYLKHIQNQDHSVLFRLPHKILLLGHTVVLSSQQLLRNAATTV